MKHFTTGKYLFGIVALFFVAGIAVYVFFSVPQDEASAYVSISGLRSKFDLFKDYETWPSSNTHVVGTKAEWLHTVSSDAAGASPTTFADVNGDGLADILVHQEYILISSSPNERHSYYGILLNQGDLTFDFLYKCVFKNVSGIDTFYGDCAAL
jgi:hypothetical protein